MRVAFLGLGAMGYPIAGHLQNKLSSVSVWNRTHGVAVRHAEEYGTTVLDARAAASADVVFTCLPTSREVDETIAEVAPGLPAGATWVDLTSGEPAAARDAALRLSRTGVTYLDARVSGGRAGARAGTLTVMAGGEADGLERVRPLLSSFAAKVVHMGTPGSGFAMKAVNNTMLAIHLVAAAEGLRALARDGVDSMRALEVLNASSGRSHVTERLLPDPLAKGEFPITFKLALLAKDARIGAKLMARDDRATLTALALEALERTSRERGGEVDYLELFDAERS